MRTGDRGGGSLRLAAAALAGHAEPVLVVGCDQPALQLAHLQQLLVGAATVASGCAATLHQGAPGMPAVLSPQLLAAPARLHGDRGLREQLRALPAEAVWPMSAPELALDIDTTDDLRAAIVRGLVDP